MPPVRTQAEWELQQHRDKLATTYNSLLSDFSSPDLHTVGNYSLGRLLGKGSFGKVYLAHHKLTNGSRVVLKSAAKGDANLAREIHHHRQFLHPHIARLYEIIVTETLVWMVLEYCPGDELYTHLLTHGRMELAKVQKIFTQLIGAVSYVHAKNCVHRDLKLENILLDKHEDVKLIDFGFTREYQGSTSYLQTWCGTVCYSAPEMLRGEKYAAEKVDVWSLGIILYALLCGELPFDEDDDNATKIRILAEDPKYPGHIPDQARELMTKMLSKRPLLRPCLSDILKDPWLAEYAPQQQEILKLQQPAPFSTQLEKDTLQRMRSAGVDIDMVIEHVLSQRCDSLAGWWALLIDKEQRKERRRERKRKEREAEKRLSTASGRLLSLGEIHEGDEPHLLTTSPRRVSRGRRSTRTSFNGRPISVATLESPDLPAVDETKPISPDSDRPPPIKKDSYDRGTVGSRSGSRPPPPPKENAVNPTVRRPRNLSRGNGSMLRIVTTNPDLLSPSYVPPQQRKKKVFYQQPLREQLAMVKHWFKESAKRAKSPGNAADKKGNDPGTNGKRQVDAGSNQRELPRRTTSNLAIPNRKASIGSRPELQQRATFPSRPRLNTSESNDSRISAGSIRGKRTSLSPHTLTPHSSMRRPSAGLRGRKSTSSSVSSVRSMIQSGHRHSQSKASSISSDSVASPSGMSSTSGSRLARSPHSSIKVLPSTPTGSGSLPSGIRFSRKPPPSAIGTIPSFGEARSAFGTINPVSPGLPVFARRKRSVFKGPMIHGGGSPAGFNRVPLAPNSRSGSVQGRRSGEMTQVLEEDEDAELEAEMENEMDADDDIEEVVSDDDDGEEEEDDDGDVEEVDHFGPALHNHFGPSHSAVTILRDTAAGSEPVSPGHLTPVPPPQHSSANGVIKNNDPHELRTSPLVESQSAIPLTEEALAQKLKQDEAAKR